MSNEGSKITLKLLVDVRNKKVLVAEAEKEFVDFMFTLLTLPLGSVIKLLTAEAMIGSTGNLYNSLNNLSDTYLMSNKETLLKPMIAPSDALTTLLLGSAKATNGMIPTLLLGLAKATIGAGQNGEGGFVKGSGFIYTITDDLQVTPSSPISLFDRFNIKRDVQVKVETLVVGKKEGLALLHASLESSTVLTDVFFNSSTEKKC